MVVLDVGEEQEEVVLAKAGGVGAEDATGGIVATLLEGGADMVDKIGVLDGVLGE